MVESVPQKSVVNRPYSAVLSVGFIVVCDFYIFICVGNNVFLWISCGCYRGSMFVIAVSMVVCTIKAPSFTLSRLTLKPSLVYFITLIILLIQVRVHTL